MSVQTKKRFKNLGKIVGIVLFVALMFTNIKVALTDTNEFADGNISLLGIEITLFDATYAETNMGFCRAVGCPDYGPDICAAGSGPNGTFLCFGTIIIT